MQEQRTLQEQGSPLQEEKDSHRKAQGPVRPPSRVFFGGDVDY